MQLYLVSALVFALIVAVFAVQNTMMVTISFLLWEFSISLVLVILGAAAIGALCVFLVGAFKNINSWRKQRDLEGKNKLLTEKVSELEKRLNELKPQEEVIEDNTEIHKTEEAVQATNIAK
ncbi:MAG: LapA family protein [Bacillota bacterium]